jgi:signal transduction histidine kinase
VAILIEDTGPGVPPAMIDRMTEPFFTTKQVGEGSGLGLSMVKGFAEQSGGRLELRNRPSRGLQVALILPLV